MIIFTDNFSNNKNELISLIEIEQDNIKTSIKSQNRLKSIFLSYIQNFALNDKHIELDSSSKVVNFLEKSKTALSYCDDNSSDLKELLSRYDNLIYKITCYFNEPEKNNLILEDTITTLNEISSKVLTIVTNSTLEMHTFLSDFTLNSDFNFLKNNINLNTSDINIDIEENANNTTAISKEPSRDEIIDKVTNSNTSSSAINTEKINTISDLSSKYRENTLIISENTGNVLLPFSFSELDDLLKYNPDKYTDIEDIIIQDFTIPINIYKNHSLSRFKEAFKLMRNKEDNSLASAFDLGMELLFSYNLHPAIITACKSLDELDIYLDYLDDNETKKFECFDIVFDVAPVLNKKKKDEFYK